jgi:hypothetical protein
MRKIFYKYRSINDYTLDSIKNNYFYFTQPKDFNDLFDTLIPNDFTATPEDVINWGWKFQQNPLVVLYLYQNIALLKESKFLDNMKRGMEKFRDSCYVFCVSEDFDNSVMWGNYANSNSGICLGYETEFKCNTYLLEITQKIVNPFVIYEDNRIYSVLTKVDYSRTNLDPYNPFKHNSKTVHDGFLNKDPKWSYEHEYRAILVDYIHTKINQKISYQKDILKEIIFGARTKIDDKKKIISIVNTNYNITNIRFYDIEINNTMHLYKKEIDYKSFL